MKKKKIVFGIDLGTTNSALATCVGERPEIVRVAGYRTVPSCIEYLSNGTKVVGRDAYAHRDQSNVVYSSKRYMGTEHKFNLTLEDGKQISVTPIEAATEVLKYIKDNADINYGTVEDVVITVPAYFNSSQRQDTLKAAKAAGLNCLKIINEPTAASLVYGSEHKDNTDVNQYIVIDVGGGTTDITVINMCYINEVHELLKGIIEPGYNFDIVSTGGNNHLGGDDYDTYIFEYIKKDILEKKSDRNIAGIEAENIKDLTEEIFEKDKQKFIFAIEKFKKTVFNGDSLLSHEIFIDNEKKGSVYIKASDYVNGFKLFWEDILKCIYECVGNNPLPKHCILVGGSTKNPLISENLKQMYSARYGAAIDMIIPDNSFADESVALGAAIYAASITGNRNDIRVKEVNPLPIGIECAEKIGGSIEYGLFQPIISKDTALPVSRIADFVTAADNQTKAILRVFQGISRYTKANQFLGELVIDDITPAPAGEEGYTLSINISFDGLVSLKANYKDKVYNATLNNVLGEVKELSAKDKLMVKIVSRALPYYESIYADDKLEALNDWEPGESLPAFLSEDNKLIDDFYYAKSVTKLHDITNEFSEDENEDDSDAENS